MHDVIVRGVASSDCLRSCLIHDDDIDVRHSRIRRSPIRGSRKSRADVRLGRTIKPSTVLSDASVGRFRARFE